MKNSRRIQDSFEVSKSMNLLDNMWILNKFIIVKLHIIKF